GLVALISRYAESVASEVFNNACEKESTRYATDPPEIVVVALLVIALPLVLARSKGLVVANLVIALMTLFRPYPPTFRNDAAIRMFYQRRRLRGSRFRSSRIRAVVCFCCSALVRFDPD